jgi:hypothetical protein
MFVRVHPIPWGGIPSPLSPLKNFFIPFALIAESMGDGEW